MMLLVISIVILKIVWAKDNAMQTRPVLLIPGFASSQLQSWSHYRCATGFRNNLFRDINFGDRVWVDVARVLAQSDCWIDCMKLDIATQEERVCKLRAAQGLEAVSELDPGIVTGPLSTIWRRNIQDMVDHFGLDPEQLVVATYDWRLPSSKLQQRDKFFLSLKRKIELTVEMDGYQGGMVVIAHSMGNSVFRYFLEWLKEEVGRNNWQKWLDSHISAYFAVGSPLLGSIESLELITSGLTEGLPITQSEMRKLVVSFGSILSFLPISSGLGIAEDNDVLVTVRFRQEDASKNELERVRNFTSADVASGQFFREMATHDPIFAQLETMRAQFYAKDSVFDHSKPFERPPIASVYSVYGVNVPTKAYYEYESTATPERWFQVQLKNEIGHELTCRKTGDGTVPYHSLSFAHTWLGSNGSIVRVTQTPQSVYFSRQNITRVRAIRHARRHAEYALLKKNMSICEAKKEALLTSGTSAGFFAGLFGSQNHDKITFFESSKKVNGVTYSTGVWEMDGVGHRDIISNPTFLRELRAELRHIFNGKSNSDKSSRPPVVDGDCYWNYRYAYCEFSDFCEYRYVFGDMTFDQSCRIRIKENLLAPTSSASPFLGVSALTAHQEPVDVAFTGPYCSAPCQFVSSSSPNTSMS
ncbi:phospholipid sterol acyl transferase 1 [Plasmopara halstedii]|uniref:Phospholipid sterol acyl transferase 1 n=1 Tax=Plasmopara halstedii TaxID=4781 RepID=A0A0P1AZL5_PLAHL|nr:phospholipid sterol acyl transferase 1 [Plasmopara halstedii]CEG47269.1 phospholipid sterol acyl transferase 1 [Plasmopara halstedii]|eukprot:XP_024583638.1 phospholipid sterol acyl transferase 1 [Plasmopara halstedii]